MSSRAVCKICGVRHAKRFCPAVDAGICSICCGTEREVSLSCPLECEYLREAHRHEKPIPIAEKDLAAPDIKVTEEFVASHEELVMFSIYSLLQATLHTADAVDSDVLDALSALTQTHRTLDSGLYYETISPNAVAAGIQRGFSASLADYQKLRQEREALSPVRNSEILATLVFLNRVGQQNQNGRPRGKMFIDLLRQMTPETPIKPTEPSLIV
jgi:hypothetical protein